MNLKQIPMIILIISLVQISSAQTLDSVVIDSTNTYSGGAVTGGPLLSTDNHTGNVTFTPPNPNPMPFGSADVFDGYQDANSNFLGGASSYGDTGAFINNNAYADPFFRGNCDFGDGQFDGMVQTEIGGFIGPCDCVTLYDHQDFTSHSETVWTGKFIIPTAFSSVTGEFQIDQLFLSTLQGRGEAAGSFKIEVGPSPTQLTTLLSVERMIDQNGIPSTTVGGSSSSTAVDINTGLNVDFTASTPEDFTIEGCDTNDPNATIDPLMGLTEYFGATTFDLDLGAVAAGDLYLRYTETTEAQMYADTASATGICYKDLAGFSIGARAGDPFNLSGTNDPGDPDAFSAPEFSVTSVVPEPASGLGIVIALPLLMGLVRRRRQS